MGAGDPAERAGLRAGDRILGIDGESTDGMSLADALQRLRGEAGTSVGVSVRRPKTGETVDVMIERAASCGERRGDRAVNERVSLVRVTPFG